MGPHALPVPLCQRRQRQPINATTNYCRCLHRARAGAHAAVGKALLRTRGPSGPITLHTVDVGRGLETTHVNNTKTTDSSYRWLRRGIGRWIGRFRCWIGCRIRCRIGCRIGRRTGRWTGRARERVHFAVQRVRVVVLHSDAGKRRCAQLGLPKSESIVFRGAHRCYCSGATQNHDGWCEEISAAIVAAVHGRNLFLSQR